MKKIQGSKRMETYYVSKDTKFVAHHELSVSNDIVKKESALVVLEIVRRWVKQIFPNDNYIVYWKGDVPSIDMFTMYDPDAIGDKTRLLVVRMKSNVRFRIGIFETEYKIERAMR